MIRARVIGTGHYLPERVLTNFDLEKMMDTSDEWIRQRTGIEQRHVAAPDQATSDLAVLAAQRALKDSGLAPFDVDLIICCTTTPDHLFPATACLIQHRIEARNAAAFDLNAACSGFVYGLATATAFIESGRFRRVLLIGAEVATNRLNWRNRDTAVLFGDGAGAVVLQGEEGDRGVLSTYLAADGADANLLMLPAGGSRIVPTKENIGTEVHDFQMRGQELFKRAVLAFGSAIQKALEQNGISASDVDLFIPHQANVRIIQAAADRAGLSGDKVFLNLDKVGNTTAASIPIALDQALQAGRVVPGKLILLAAFGAGLTWGSAVIRW